MKPYLKPLLVTLLCFTLQSCFIGKAIETKKARQEFTVENEAIPPDFGKNEDEVLLFVLKGRRSFDKWIKKAAKGYTGAHELVLESDMSNSKYSDKVKYRYKFDYSPGTVVTRTNMSTGRSSSSTYKRYYVGDRMSDKTYQSGAEFTYFAKAMRVYVENLNLKRIAEQSAQ